MTTTFQTGAQVRASTGGPGAERAPRWFWIGLAGVVLVALILRLWWAVYASKTPIGLFDPARYLRSAQAIAHGYGYVEPFTAKATAYYPPGFPWFFGIVTWIADHNPVVGDPVRLMAYVQALLGAASVGAVGVIGWRVRSAAAGVFGALLVALYPNLIFLTAAMLSETLCIALLTGALAVLWWRPSRVPLSSGRLVAFSVLFALGVMVRPISLPVLVVVLALWWRAWGNRAAFLRAAGVAIGVLVVVMGAWTVRNAIRMHAFVPISTNTGDNLCIGHSPGATGAFRLTMECATKQGVMQGPAGEIAHDRQTQARARKWIAGHLSREPWLTWRRLYFMFQHDHDGLLGVTSYRTDHWMPDATWNSLSRIADDYGAVILGLGIVGSALLLYGHRDGQALVAITAVLLAVPLCFFGDARFKDPAMPLLALAAACTLVEPFEWAVRHRARSDRVRR
ncbi:MAG TPA: hypothetical protein VHA73_07875 [Acidimicrobiales bacterium]|nr:hypothetical protein [Acidimicrobiales bacterium]